MPHVTLSRPLNSGLGAETKTALKCGEGRPTEAPRRPSPSASLGPHCSVDSRRHAGGCSGAKYLDRITTPAVWQPWWPLQRSPSVGLRLRAPANRARRAGERQASKRPCDEITAHTGRLYRARCCATMACLSRHDPALLTNAVTLWRRGGRPRELAENMCGHEPRAQRGATARRMTARWRDRSPVLRVPPHR
jgi:hypothetical protein